jgi:hypothetical protein
MILPAPHLSVPSGQGQPPSAICAVELNAKTRTRFEKKRQKLFIKLQEASHTAAQYSLKKQPVLL